MRAVDRALLLILSGILGLACSGLTVLGGSLIAGAMRTANAARVVKGWREHVRKQLSS